MAKKHKHPAPVAKHTPRSRERRLHALRALECGHIDVATYAAALEAAHAVDDFMDGPEFVRRMRKVQVQLRNLGPGHTNLEFQREIAAAYGRMAEKAVAK